MNVRYDLLSPELKSTPYPAYADMRRNAPVCVVDPGGLWAVSRYDDVMFVLKHPQLFSSRGFGMATNPEWLGGNPFAESMLAMDPPEHGRLRGLVQGMFGSAAMVRLEPRVREVTSRVVAQLPLGRTLDVMPSLAMSIPVEVMGELLGVEPAMRPHLRRWADLMTGGVTTVRPDEHERKRIAREAVAEVRGYFGELLAARRRHPGEDVLSQLLAARPQGEALTRDELLAFVAVLLVGGIESTVHLLGSSVHLLSKHPELLGQLHADRALLPAFIDEVLRIEPPAQAVLRTATQELYLSGVRIPKNAPVLALLGSACRDENVFPEPNRFILQRPGTHQLPFGHGIHFCLGMPLARMEGRLMLEALLDRCGGLESGAEPMSWHRTLVVRGPATLPVTLRTV
ncbi:cytochrome P450 [Myxococcus sp. K15C18031901]|uniref:cytochrome P450 n=1 Tax=Myxococcus dinghuensis TaxID=2906761 RepID=UPI0020A7A1BE|nr:cytochrome P450 [Myxococcus dinghuensis]MCP3102843.1 cytochrome P450 [Myxococcus dinghuensis]